MDTTGNNQEPGSRQAHAALEDPAAHSSIGGQDSIAEILTLIASNAILLLMLAA